MSGSRRVASSADLSRVSISASRRLHSIVLCASSTPCLVSCRFDGCLDICVSKASLGRSLRIAGALLKAAEKAGILAAASSSVSRVMRSGSLREKLSHSPSQQISLTKVRSRSRSPQRVNCLPVTRTCKIGADKVELEADTEANRPPGSSSYSPTWKGEEPLGSPPSRVMWNVILAPTLPIVLSSREVELVQVPA